jgi:hypothetical protein
VRGGSWHITSPQSRPQRHSLLAETDPVVLLSIRLD